MGASSAGTSGRGTAGPGTSCRETSGSGNSCRGGAVRGTSTAADPASEDGTVGTHARQAGDPQPHRAATAAASATAASGPEGGETPGLSRCMEPPEQRRLEAQRKYNEKGSKSQAGMAFFEAHRVADRKPQRRETSDDGSRNRRSSGRIAVVVLRVFLGASPDALSRILRVAGPELDVRGLQDVDVRPIGETNETDPYVGDLLGDLHAEGHHEVLGRVERGPISLGGEAAESIPELIQVHDGLPHGCRWARRDSTPRREAPSRGDPGGRSHPGTSGSGGPRGVEIA